MDKVKKKSLFICGHCGVDTKKSNQEIKKVIIGNLANMLCTSCQKLFEDSIRDVARIYLSKKAIATEHSFLRTISGSGVSAVRYKGVVNNDI